MDQRDADASRLCRPAPQRIMQTEDDIGKVATASPVVMGACSAPPEDAQLSCKQLTNTLSHMPLASRRSYKAKATELFLREMVEAIEKEARAKSTKKVSMHHVCVLLPCLIHRVRTITNNYVLRSCACSLPASAQSRTPPRSTSSKTSSRPSQTRARPTAPVWKKARLPARSAGAPGHLRAARAVQLDPQVARGKPQTARRRPRLHRDRTRIAKSQFPLAACWGQDQVMAPRKRTMTTRRTMMPHRQRTRGWQKPQHQYRQRRQRKKTRTMTSDGYGGASCSHRLGRLSIVVLVKINGCVDISETTVLLRHFASREQQSMCNGIKLRGGWTHL